MYIFLFLSADTLFSTLTKNTQKKLKLKKGQKFKKSNTCPNFVFDQKLFINFYSINDFFYTNYILMFIRKRSICTRGLKKFQHQNFNQNCVPKLQKQTKNRLGVKAIMSSPIIRTLALLW